MPDVDIPNRVANVAITSHVGDIGVTTLFTPSADGLFRVSAYYIISTGGLPAGDVAIGWQDEYSTTRSFQFGMSGTLVLRALSNTAITYQTNSTSGTYDLFLVVEQLF